VVSEDRDRRSRRGLLGATGLALGTAAAVVLEACGATSTAGDGSGTTTGHGHRPARSPHDARLLGSALELERRTVDAYVACVPLLDHHVAKAAAEWMSEEVQHTGKLITLIRQAGGTAASRANSYDIGPRPHGQAQTLRLLAGLEQLQLSFYLRALPRFEQGSTRAAVASIFANDAQHLSLLRLVADQPPVPSAFVA
jgi:Ferritin-like domain